MQQKAPNDVEFNMARRTFHDALERIKKSEHPELKVTDDQKAIIAGLIAQALAKVRAAYVDHVAAAESYRKSYLAFAEELGVEIDPDGDEAATDRRLMDAFRTYVERREERVRSDCAQEKKPAAKKPATKKKADYTARKNGA